MSCAYSFLGLAINDPHGNAIHVPGSAYAAGTQARHEHGDERCGPGDDEADGEGIDDGEQDLLGPAQRGWGRRGFDRYQNTCRTADR